MLWKKLSFLAGRVSEYQLIHFVCLQLMQKVMDDGGGSFWTKRI